MILSERFDSCFEALTGNAPFPWQQALFHDHFLKLRFPARCDIPTGLGKTSIIALWLIALAHHARSGTALGFPRRLVYVINRRTVVDQATLEAERMREALIREPELRPIAKALESLGSRSSDNPIAISTLRGQFADNAEWRDDPTCPAVVVGTVDMIGSRLLFSGYGRGFKSRPLHAAFLGQDALLVHDEAHLEPAFQALATAIEQEQERCRDFRRVRVVALTATSRSGGESFGLKDADHRHPEVRKRVKARKEIKFFPIDDESKTADEILRLALRHKHSGERIIVFVRKLEHVEKVVTGLRAARLGDQTQALTGTIRGYERDALATSDPIFARFMAKPNPKAVLSAGTVYLVCTSAGEVGVDISADHMICDLTPFDSMAQRLGRVNRFGEGDATIDIVHEIQRTAEAAGTRTTEPDESTEDRGSFQNAGAKEKSSGNIAFDCARKRTLSLLELLPRRGDRRYDACPAALADLPQDQRHAAFSPSPVVVPVSDILFDAWALTSVRDRLPGRPPVADWLHGVADWEAPETHVAWREEIGVIIGNLLTEQTPEDLLDEYPLKPHELLRDRTYRVFKQLEKLAAGHGQSPAWIVDEGESVTVTTLAKVVEEGRNALSRKTVLLPPGLGGLDSSGMLDGTIDPEDRSGIVHDVADLWIDEKGAPRRSRVWDDEDPPRGMRLVRTIDTRPNSEEDDIDGRRSWHWYVKPRSADDDGSQCAVQKQELTSHLLATESFATKIAAKLDLGDPEASAVRIAARWHDLGKNRAVWQRSIGNHDYPEQVLAKSGRGMHPIKRTEYRHELGSVLDLQNWPDFRILPQEVRELALHLIAAHHGRARPHFPIKEAFDPERRDEEAAEIAREVPRRFARLQRKYGRWGLAYIESLVRAADALASQSVDMSVSAGALPRSIPRGRAR